MGKHAGCVAPISPAGWVPGLPWKRLAKPYGCAWSAPQRVEMEPVPSLRPPFQEADPYVFISGSPCPERRNTEPTVAGGHPASTPHSPKHSGPHQAAERSIATAVASPPPMQRLA